MNAPGKSTPKKLYTVAEANAALPLVKAIVRDVAELARELRERHERLSTVQAGDSRGRDALHQEELDQAQVEFDRGRERMEELEGELRQLGVELKDYVTGLIDFRSRMGGREVYLCWRLGEADVSHWHELDAGFAGRKPLRATNTPVSPLGEKGRG
jgi:hypothetical protein